MSSSSPNWIREYLQLGFGLLESQKYCDTFTILSSLILFFSSRRWTPSQISHSKFKEEIDQVWQKFCQLFWFPWAHPFSLGSTNIHLTDVTHLISEVWPMRSGRLTSTCAPGAISTSNNRSIKPCTSPTSCLVAGNVGSAFHLQERKGGSSWKLMKRVNCMEKSVEQGIHVSLPFTPFELNQLKSTPSQLRPVFSGFDWLQTCCH